MRGDWIIFAVSFVAVVTTGLCVSHGCLYGGRFKAVAKEMLYMFWACCVLLVFAFAAWLLGWNLAALLAVVGGFWLLIAAWKQGYKRFKNLKTMDATWANNDDLIYAINNRLVESLEALPCVRDMKIQYDNYVVKANIAVLGSHSCRAEKAVTGDYVGKDEEGTSHTVSFSCICFFYDFEPDKWDVGRPAVDTFEGDKYSCKDREKRIVTALRLKEENEEFRGLRETEKQEQRCKWRFLNRWTGTCYARFLGIAGPIVYFRTGFPENKTITKKLETLSTEEREWIRKMDWEKDNSIELTYRYSLLDSLLF